MIPSLAGMDPVDYIRFASLVLGFGATAFCAQKTWVRADVLMCTALGVGWLFFPQVFFKFQVSGQLGPVHDFYGSMVGLSTLLFAVPILQNRKTRDEKVFSSFFLARAITFKVMLLTIFVAHWKYASGALSWTPKHFWFAGLAAAGWLLGNLRHLVSSGGTSQGLSRRPERDALSYHLFVDVFFMLTGTLFFFGFGELTLKNLAVTVGANDGVLSHLEHVGSTITFGNCLMALAAHSFDDIDAIKNVFVYRLWTIGSFSALFMYYQYFYGLLNANFLWSVIPSYGVFAANSLLAIKYINDNYE